MPETDDHDNNSGGAKAPIALEDRASEADRLYSPSAARNRDPILEAFKRLMPEEGAILEIASGTGEHGVHIAAALPNLTWFPGDPDPASRASVAAWTKATRLSNMRPPHDIDASAAAWTVDGAPLKNGLAGMVCINMIHIAPFAAAKGLIAGAGRYLAPGGKLFLYGPFSRNGAHTAPSNADFDASLKARDPDWGVRDLEGDITPLAEAAGLIPDAVLDLPANNFAVTFQKRA